MRPRRIARRLIARYRHWGIPHTHCPSCGCDTAVPKTEDEQICFTCRIHWQRVDLSGDLAADTARIAELAGDRRFLWTMNPLLIDVPGPGDTKTTANLPCAYVYYPDTLP